MNINVIDKRKENPKVYLYTLGRGEVFEHKDRLYIKTDNCGNEDDNYNIIYCVNLYTGEKVKFDLTNTNNKDNNDNDIMVNLVNIDLIIYPYNNK